MNSIYISDKNNEGSRRYCQLFFRNVDYLLKKRGISKIEMVKRMASGGFKVNRMAISKYIKGTYWSARIGYLDAYARFLGEPMPLLLLNDYEAEERLREGLG